MNKPIRLIPMLLVAVCLASPLSAKMWKPDTTMVNTANVEVKGKEADIAVKAAADAVVAQSETGKLKDSTVQHMNQQIEKYTDQRDIHPGIGIGGTVDFGGDFGADLLMTLRKGDLIGILSVGYDDIGTAVKHNEWDMDNVKVGLGAVYEF